MVTYWEANSNIRFITLGFYSVIPTSFRICDIICASFSMLVGDTILPDSMIPGDQTSRAKSPTLMYCSPDLAASSLPSVVFPTSGVPVSRLFRSNIVLTTMVLGTSAHRICTFYTGLSVRVQELIHIHMLNWFLTEVLFLTSNAGTIGYPHGKKTGLRYILCTTLKNINSESQT